MATALEMLNIKHINATERIERNDAHIVKGTKV